MKRLAPLLALLLGVSAVPQDDKNPYLNQREMFGQAVFRISGGGTRNDAGYHVDRSISIEFRIQLDPNEAKGQEAMRKVLASPQGGIVPEKDRPKLEAQLHKHHWVMDPRKKDQSRRISISDSNTNSAGARSRIGSETYQEQSTAMLTIDDSSNTYDLVIVLPDGVMVAEKYTGKPPIDKTGMQIIGEGASRVELKDIPLPGPGQPFSGTVDLSKSLSRFRPYPDFGSIEGTLEWSMRPKPFEPLELVLDIDQYEKWLPNAGEDETVDGPNPLTVIATLKNKGGGAIEDKIESLTFVLTDVSDEPGVACNWPMRPKQGLKIRDLWFPADKNAGLVRIRDEGLVVRALKPGPTTTAVIASRDWGAWGTLHVGARMETGRWIDGYVPSLPGNPRIPIPKRTKDSKIADAWKKPPYDQRPDDWDGEDDPPGKTTRDGDGLSLYEEYRGFMVNGTHVCGDPTKKDIFIVDLNQHPKVKAGIKLFKDLSGLAVHADLKPDEMHVGWMKPAEPEDRRINANSRAFKIVEQHGVVLEPFNDRLVGRAGAYGPGDKNEHTTPKDYTGITFPSAAAAIPSTLLKRPKKDRQGADVLTSVIAHELFHTVNVPHHGDDDVDVHWVIKKDASGGWTMTENGKPVTMVYEDGTPFKFIKEADGSDIHLGISGGKYSGFEECVMRYFNADAYVDPNNQSVRINVRGDDAPGDKLCTGKAGMEINADSWVNHGRFKEAKVGNCKSFICVNDQYK